ncbi:hypothetical protein H6F38_14235 [Paenibacillus sp. EKM208P]|nr:hypothetical protein H6F38_14235 [Paenibacillus sp. EKM208P]
MKKLKEVTFGLENCEALSIKGEYIGNFGVENIKSSIRKHYNNISHFNVCDTFSMAINRGANKGYYAFDTKDEHYKQNTFKRLTQGDIVSVDIIYDDDTKDEFYVHWEGENDYLNEAQKTYISELGDLFIVVSKDETVESEFGHWNIDSEKGSMNTMWKINSIK